MNATCATVVDPTARVRCRATAGARLQEAWLERLAFGPLAEQAAEVQRWSGIFPVSWHQLPHASLLRNQLITIEEQLSGTFTDLLTAMVLDPALQISLNGPANHRGNPNENLARELLELFSLGEGHYGEADVKEAARALTGYRLDAEGRLLLDPRRHDPGAKTILGRTDAFDGASLARWLCRQSATARHILGRVWRQRIGPLPSAARLEALAEQWRQQDLSLPWLRTTLAQLPEARASRGRRLEDPIVVVARSLALLGSPHSDALRMGRVQLAAMGQPILDPPSVKGWPVDAEWINLRWLQARRRGLLLLLGDEEVWSSRRLGPELEASLTPLPPLTLSLPAKASREMVALLFADPVWQLA